MAIKRTTIKVKNLKQPECLLHVQGTKNNFRLTLCDPSGNVLKQDTAGMKGDDGVQFKGAKKSTPHAANVVSARLAHWALDRGVQRLHVFVKSVGIGPEMAIRTMHNKGLDILSAKNVMGVPHGGCKPRKKPRK